MNLTIRTAQDIAAQTEAEIHEAARTAARSYLDSTDWLIVRQTETGAAVPQSILERRSAARALLGV